MLGGGQAVRRQPPHPSALPFSFSPGGCPGRRYEGGRAGGRWAAARGGPPRDGGVVGRYLRAGGRAAPLCGRGARGLGGAGRRGSLWGAEAGGPVVAGGGESGPGWREGPRPRRGERRICVPMAVPGLPAWASRCWRPAGAARPAAAGFLRLGAPLAAAGDARNGPFCVWGRVRGRPGRAGRLFCSSSAPAKL